MLEIYKFNVFTTNCEILIYTDNKKKSDKACQEVLLDLKRLEKKYNFFDNNSYLSKINNRLENKLDNETYKLLNICKKYFNQTQKVFDVTYGTIKGVKDPKLREKLIHYINFENICFNKNKIEFKNEFTKLDFGGVVKEYGVDLSKNILKKHKIKSALLNFGGDIFVIGKKPNGEKFSVGVKNPLNPNEIFKTFKLENQSLTTSANYERYEEVGNEKLNHIYSGFEKHNNIISSTVVGNSCLESGILSTSLLLNKDILVNNGFKYLITDNLEIIK